MKAVFLNGGPGQVMAIESENLVVAWSESGCILAVKAAFPLGADKPLGTTMIYHETNVARPADEAQARMDAANVIARFFFSDFLAISGAEDFAFGKNASRVLAGLKSIGKAP